MIKSVFSVSLSQLNNRKIRKTMEKLVSEILAKMEVFKTDAALQVEKGNKAAGTRARKVSLEIEKLMKQFRKDSVEAAK